MKRKTIPKLYWVQLVVVLTILLVLTSLGFMNRWASHMEVPENLLMAAILLMVATSFINFTLFYINATHTLPPQDIGGLLIPNKPLYRGTILVAVNLGGAILPCSYAIGLWFYLKINPYELLPTLVITSIAAYLFSRPIHGMGIALPILTVPFVTALNCKIFSTEHLMPGAYIAGTIGVILGADILRIKDMKRIGSSFISFGGAGIFDGIILTGIIASLVTLII